MVYCGECGTPGEGRFCIECGTRLHSGESSSAVKREDSLPNASQAEPLSSGGTSPYSSPTPGSSSTRPNVRGVSTVSGSATTQGGTFPATPNVPQQESPTQLFGSQGYRLEAFHIISRELFIALDRTTLPTGTQLIEASKIRRFKEVAGRPIPPFFESHVLPLYYQTIGAQCAGSSVLTWEGWNTYLAHKILSNPDDTFAHIGAALRGLGIQLPWPLVRSDFPAYAYPDAAARELQFQQGIRDYIGASFSSGAYSGLARRRSGMAAGIAARSLTGLLSNGFLFN
ncbi:hypothetical protein MIND_00256900 [Mycena indigotica]|uniref:Uncharacterized protein n=1 Tax=Mycena indigotica TaxID=2126181 RepID=A0A8H6WBA9_9AGAR|nr:uncharacterized protein MIND_00256900 [Mycena indigotica]KAF7312434.1 hypothetical protein MIND_00256900 [Mycena indigotica]